MAATMPLINLGAFCATHAVSRGVGRRSGIIAQMIGAKGKRANSRKATTVITPSPWLCYGMWGAICSLEGASLIWQAYYRAPPR